MMVKNLKFRSPRHEKAYLLRQRDGLSYRAIARILECSGQNAYQIVRDALIEKKPPGRPNLNSKPRNTINAFLSPEVIRAIRAIAIENKTTISHQVELRLVRTLIEEGMLPPNFSEHLTKDYPKKGKACEKSS